jgi:hypothetical protein
MRTAAQLELGNDELAIAFAGADGLSAEELGKFLQRAGAVTRRSGVELRVVAFEEGSFLVRCKAFAKHIGKNARKEALENPIRTVLGTAAVAIAAAALSQNTSVHSETVSPLASESARIIERHNVTIIQVITVDETTVLMDRPSAREIRERELNRVPRRPRTALQRLSAAVRDEVNGETFDVGGEVHFRADGFQYTVPVYPSYDYIGPRLMAGRRYKVSGSLNTRRGQPDSMEISEAHEMP